MIFGIIETNRKLKHEVIKLMEEKSQVEKELRHANQIIDGN